MLRAILVTLIVIFGIRQSLKSPFFALLFYLWISYFRPEQWLWWDFVSQLRLALIVGVIVLGATLLSGRKLQFGVGPALLFLFLGQSLMSTIASTEFAYSWAYWQDFAKSTIISFLIVTLVDDEKKLRMTLLVIGMSLGLEAGKQGWGQLVLNPTAQNINEHPVLGDNNGVAVGMLMLVPMLLALGQTAIKKKERWFHQFVAAGVLYRALFTYSRGGFLACAALVLHYLARSKRKLVAIVSLSLVGLLILPVLPDQFWERMNSIPRGSEEIETSDYSTRGRVHFWYVAAEMANANPLTGVGHNAYNVHYNDYDFSHGQYGKGRSVHSSWFAVLAELGYPGFFMFVMLVGHALLSCRRARRLAKKNPAMKDLALYATAIEAALVTFAIGGSFVIFQYSEMLWHTLALSMVIDRLVARRAKELVEMETVTAPPVIRLPPRLGVAARMPVTRS